MSGRCVSQIGTICRALRCPVHGAHWTVLDEIALERRAQDAKWGADRIMPNGTGHSTDFLTAELARLRCNHAFQDGRGSWRHILDEEVAEAFAESDPAKLRAELVQVAAVAVAWIEMLDRIPASPAPAGGAE